jgi:RNA polymerase sigma-70 factor (ECF subfamily)
MQDSPRAGQRLTHDEFTRLVDQHQHRLHVYLAGMLRHTEQAFDLVQETFCEAWCAAQKGTRPFLPGTDDLDVRRWLFRVASNRAISLLRRGKRIRWESLDGIEEPLLGVSDAFEERIAEGEMLAASLAQLAPQDVACLLLRVVHGFSASETGSILNMSADNVNTRLARAKQRLRTVYVREQQSRQKTGAHQ